jgi:pimeloyl-ACP methyl ester carboxylesterase
MIEPADCRLSSPLHLQVRTSRRHGQVLSVREHLPPYADDDPALPLVIITFHPGYAAGSYEDRDYFELLTPLLFAQCRDCCRLRIFTINHPGYDLPHGYKVDRFDLKAYSIRSQPRVIEQVLRWLLLGHFGAEDELYLFAYGHSMGGLALARADLQPLQRIVGRQGRRLQIQKVLSAPAIILQERARANLSQLNALNTIKRTLGRVPLYDSVAQGLFRGLSPILYRMQAESYTLNPDCTFIDFPRYNPFILLEQGLELLRLDYGRESTAALLEGCHVILSRDDGMVNSTAIQQAAEHAGASGADVWLHMIDSSHNAERDDPDLCAGAMCTILRPRVAGGYRALTAA